MQKLITKITSIRTQIFFTATAVAVFAMTRTAYAEGSSLSINGLLGKIFYHIINPLIMVAMAGSVVYFMYGVVDFLRKRDTDMTGAEEGKKHLMYGLIGLFIFVSAFAVARIMSKILGGGVPTP